MNLRLLITGLIALSALLTACDQSADVATPSPETTPAAEAAPPTETQAEVATPEATEPTAVAEAEESEVQAEVATPEPEVTYDVAAALSVVPSRTQYLLGEPVQVYISVANLTDENLVFRSDYFTDKSLIVMITPENGESWQYIDHRRVGTIIPSRADIPAGGSRGFFNIIAHSEVEGHALPFPEPGLYRLDFSLVCEIAEDPHLETILAAPVTIRVVEPATPTEEFLSDAFTQPWVAQAIQRRHAPEELESLFLQVVEEAPGTVFSEHADFLLAQVYAAQEQWLLSNEHLYQVYESDSAYYPKKLVLTRIFTNFHFAEEPERALATLEILLEMYPDMRTAQNHLVTSYIEQFLTELGS